MYRKQIAISFLIFTALCMGGFVLNNHLEMKEENRMLLTSKNQAENSISIDFSLLKASYKPRQYVKIGEMNYIAPSDKQIKNDWRPLCSRFLFAYYLRNRAWITSYNQRTLVDFTTEFIVK